MKTNYFALYPAPYGLSVKNLGLCEDFDEASNIADSIPDESSIWILPESELRGLQGSIENALTNNIK